MSELKVNTINETTAANGVSIDGLKIKDYSLMYGSNTGLTVSSDGYVTKPNIPIFSAYLASNQSNIAINGLRTVQFDTLHFPCSHYNTTNYEFTTPIAGKYQFNIFLRIDNIHNGAAYYQLSTNIGGGSFYGPIIDPNFSSDLAYYYFAYSVIQNIGASTAVKVQLYQSLGSSQSDIIGSNTQSNWSGFLIG